MSFSSTMTELADACRKRFVVTSKLTIDDMIKLITPPAFPSGTEILGETNISIDGEKRDVPLTLKAVPPAMNKPIKLSITFSNDDWLSVPNDKLIFNKSDGTQLALAIPLIDTDFNHGTHWVKTVNVTIPANTSIATNKAILRLYEDSEIGKIEKIIATY
jgi:hypothetical protein